MTHALTVQQRAVPFYLFIGSGASGLYRVCLPRNDPAHIVQTSVWGLKVCRFLLSTTPAEPGRTGQHGQEQVSPNHVPPFYPISVHSRFKLLRKNLMSKLSKHPLLLQTASFNPPSEISSGRPCNARGGMCTNDQLARFLGSIYFLG